MFTFWGGSASGKLFFALASHTGPLREESGYTRFKHLVIPTTYILTNFFCEMGRGRVFFAGPCCFFSAPYNRERVSQLAFMIKQPTTTTHASLATLARGGEEEVIVYFTTRADPKVRCSSSRKLRFSLFFMPPTLSFLFRVEAQMRGAIFFARKEIGILIGNVRFSYFLYLYR